MTQTERLTLRELTVDDAEFINTLLNTPKFLQYIGDRQVRTAEQAAEFIETRYRQSYIDHGFGLYAVELKDGTPIGMCGYVRRESLDGPDIGFAFLPEYEKLGYGYESASAMLTYGQETLGFKGENTRAGSLLVKLGFHFDEEIHNNGETLTTIRATKRPMENKCSRGRTSASGMEPRKGHYTFDKQRKSEHDRSKPIRDLPLRGNCCEIISPTV
ncbi:MAG: GNAT family N-acetyltransferase [Acidobacteria bacterium]|nr:GNAT family N-acetyltransferase [Acidobacteriota bacterium]